MPRDLFGKILSLDLESLVHSSWIMVFSLITKPSGGIAVIWALQISIPLWLIHKRMDMPRLLISHSEWTQEEAG